MTIVPIRTLPDPILRQKARRVKSIDKSIDRLIDDMVETMHSASGVGLAAPQVGIPLRVIVIGIPEEEELALINPQMMRRTGQRLVNEGCLSIPGYFAQVQRAERPTWWLRTLLAVRPASCRGRFGSGQW